MDQTISTLIAAGVPTLAVVAAFVRNETALAGLASRITALESRRWCSLQGSRCCIGEQRRAKAASLKPMIDSQSADADTTRRRGARQFVSRGRRFSSQRRGRPGGRPADVGVRPTRVVEVTAKRFREDRRTHAPKSLRRRRAALRKAGMGGLGLRMASAKRR